MESNKLKSGLHDLLAKKQELAAEAKANYERHQSAVDEIMAVFDAAREPKRTVIELASRERKERVVSKRANRSAPNWSDAEDKRILLYFRSHKMTPLPKAVAALQPKLKQRTVGAINQRIMRKVEAGVLRKTTAPNGRVLVQAAP